VLNRKKGGGEKVSQDRAGEKTGPPVKVPGQLILGEGGRPSQAYSRAEADRAGINEKVRKRGSRKRGRGHERRDYDVRGSLGGTLKDSHKTLRRWLINWRAVGSGTKKGNQVRENRTRTSSTSLRVSQAFQTG